jgi:hypothetical protein
MKRRTIVLAILGFVAGSGTQPLLAQDKRADPILAEAMEDATISLQQGLTSAASKGRPISAKFELEDRELQLSVYTAKGGKFSENIIDLSTGKIAKSETITDTHDLADAKAQSTAMAKARTSLQAVVDTAVHGSAGFVALSVTPALKKGQSIASVVLLKGLQLKTVDLSLK